MIKHTSLHPITTWIAAIVFISCAVGAKPELPSDVLFFIEEAHRFRETEIQSLEAGITQLSSDLSTARAGRVTRSLKPNEVVEREVRPGVTAFQFGSADAKRLKIQTIERKLAGMQHRLADVSNLDRIPSMEVRLRFSSGSPSLPKDRVGTIVFPESQLVDRHRFKVFQVIDKRNVLLEITGLQGQVHSPPSGRFVRGAPQEVGPYHERILGYMWVSNIDTSDMTTGERTRINAVVRSVGSRTYETLAGSHTVPEVRVIEVDKHRDEIISALKSKHELPSE